jgi:ADP-ribose pyrophosphatase YjhB (NUDIX family)
MSERYAVAVLLLTPAGIPLIRDPKKPLPVYWKLPGGRSEGDETPEAAATREIEEEIGIALTADDLFVIHEEERGSHTLFVFRAERSEVGHLRDRGNEGEEIRFFRPQEILSLQDFFPNHRVIVEHILKTL